MSAQATDKLGDLDKKLDEVLNMVKGSIAGNHNSFEDGLPAAAYFEDDGEADLDQAKYKAWKPNNKVPMWKKLPKGYRKHQKFSNFSDFLRKGMREKDVFEKLHAEQLDYLKKANAMTVLDSDSAGSLVLPEFAPNIMETLYENDLIGRTDQYTIAGSRMEFPKIQESSRATGSRSGGLLGYWLEEGDLMTASRPKVQGTELKLKKLCVVVFLTQDLIDDNSYAIEQWVRRAVAREIQWMIGDAIVNGTGGGMPLGLLNSSVAVQIAKESGQAAATLNPFNIVKMYSARRASVPLSDYVWLANQDIEPQLLTLSMPSGHQQPIYLPPGGFSQAPYGTIFGRPVITTEFNRTLGTRGDLMFVNLKNYITITKGGILETASPHVEFLRSQLALKFEFRIDGRPIFDAPTTPANGTQAQSDVIVLETRS